VWFFAAWDGSQVSLAFEAGAIGVAERTGGPNHAAGYRVVQVLAGQGLKAGDAITIDQVLCVTGAQIDPIAILFPMRRAPYPSELE
jgi:hypothetical protein